jgi:hypothetical protein
MAGFVLTGNDTTTIKSANGEVTLADFAGAEPVVITFENDFATIETGKNNNSIIAPNKMGRVASVAISLLLGSSDDKFLQSELNAYSRDSASYTLLTGKFIKRVGNGAGAISKKVIDLKGGIVSKLPDFKENVQGDTTQGIVVYNVKFSVGEISDL